MTRAVESDSDGQQHDHSIIAALHIASMECAASAALSALPIACESEWILKTHFALEAVLAGHSGSIVIGLAYARVTEDPNLPIGACWWWPSRTGSLRGLGVLSDLSDMPFFASFVAKNVVAVNGYPTPETSVTHAQRRLIVTCWR